MAKTPMRQRWVHLVAWFLAVSYGVGAPLTAFIEYQSHTLSDRFDLPATLIFATCAVQALCAAGVLVRRCAPWAAAILSVITIGAIVSHIRIGSPETAVAAVVFTAIQIAFGLATRPRGGRASSRPA